MYVCLQVYIIYLCVCVYIQCICVSVCLHFFLSYLVDRMLWRTQLEVCNNYLCIVLIIHLKKYIFILPRSTHSGTLNCNPIATPRRYNRTLTVWVRLSLYITVILLIHSVLFLQIYHSSNVHGTDDIRTSGGYFHMANVFYRQNKMDVAFSLYNQVSAMQPKYV